MQIFFLLLLIFTPISIAGSKLGLSPTAQFFLAAIAIIPLARFVG
jgi:Ca2+/H+ antiporter